MINKSIKKLADRLYSAYHNYALLNTFLYISKYDSQIECHEAEILNIPIVERRTKHSNSAGALIGQEIPQNRQIDLSRLLYRRAINYFLADRPFLNRY